MRAAVSAKLGLDNSVAGDQTNIDGWLNEGVVDVLTRTGCYVTSATMTETSGTGDYTLDTGILKVVGLSWSNSSTGSIPEQVSIPEILALRIMSPASTSWPASCYAVAGANLLMVWPTPSGADVITIYYVPRPTVMSSGANDPSVSTYGGVPSEYVKAVEYYACWQAGDYNNDQQSEGGERYRVLYEQMLARIRSETVRKGGRLGRAQVGALRPNARGRNRNDLWP